MCAAVQSNKDWQCKNTSVHFDPETGISIVRLHGNKIAEVSDTDMTIFDGGWQSTPPKSQIERTCAIISVLLVKVYSRKILQWYVRKFVGCVNGKNILTEDFAIWLHLCLM